MHKRTITIVFIIGLGLGAVGARLLPDYLRPYLPESITGKAAVVKGTVLAKQKEGTVLLLTVNTTQGALLATFKNKVAETGLLVDVKDRIEFTLPKYTPFIDDPKITRVEKGQEALTQEPEKPLAAPAKAGEKGAQEIKPHHKGTSKPAPGSPSEAKPQDQGKGAPASGNETGK